MDRRGGNVRDHDAMAGLLNRDTQRILNVACPLCAVVLAIHVRGLSPAITAEQWLESLELEAWEYIHAEHTRTASEVIDPPRARTRRLT